MNILDDFWKVWKKEQYKLDPKSRATARIVITVLLVMLIIAIVRAVILLTAPTGEE